MDAPSLLRAAVVLAALSLGGCGMKRALVVDSRPAGARLWVNGVERGTTPFRLPYVYDGEFTVRLEKEGYESIADEIRTVTAIDAVPGVDFFAENFGPRRQRVTVKSYALTPLKRESYTRAEMDAVLRRATEFRGRMERELLEPGTPTPTRPAPTPAPAASTPASR